MRTVLITGASGDIGRAVTAAFLADQASVIAQCHSNEAPLARLHAEWPDLVIARADLTTSAGIAEIGELVSSRWQHLDVLVNCLGGARPASQDGIDAETWRHTMALNLDAPFFVLQRLLPLIKRCSGAVVNISSVAALTGGAFGPHYAAAKAGIIGLTRSAARDLGASGIRVNCVAPGPVRSAMTETLPAHKMNAILADTALERIVEPSEVAAAVRYLAAATAITGQTLVVDGGRHLH